MGVLDDLFDVRGQVALVTGGASGLGYAFASILAETGASVVIADWNGDRLEAASDSLVKLAEESGQMHPRHAKPAISSRVLDVSDGAAVGAFVDNVVTTHGKVDIVFANAGIARGRPPLTADGTLDDFDMADYHALVDVNLHGVVHTARAAARHMKRQRSGSIVVTASTAGLRNDPFTPYSYAIAKAGVVNFMKQAAHDLARWNVRVNAIAPGPFKTSLGGGGPMPPETEARWNSVIPLGRMGDPGEIRGLALLLASPAASFMTGGTEEPCCRVPRCRRWTDDP
jgi:NAD(P)-dependent dehydrogenase (short-subunit alcohol dehydrogenase family)